MTKELEQKIYRMLKSTDQEMVFLGIQLLLNSATEHECMKMIPWNSLRHGIITTYTKSKDDIAYNSIETGKQWTRDPFTLNVDYSSSNLELNTIWIKGNIAITYLSGSLVCRRLGLMKCLWDFDNRPKLIFENDAR